MSYANAKVYKILNSITKDVYVGSTVQPLSKRMVDHRSAANSEKCCKTPLYRKMLELGVEHFYIELIEEYPCENVAQLRKREGELTREIGTLNRYIAGRTEYQCRQDNKEKRTKANKEWRDKNHNELLEKKKYTTTTHERRVCKHENNITKHINTK